MKNLVFVVPTDKRKLDPNAIFLEYLTLYFRDITKTPQGTGSGRPPVSLERGGIAVLRP